MFDLANHIKVNSLALPNSQCLIVGYQLVMEDNHLLDDAVHMDKMNK